MEKYLVSPDKAFENFNIAYIELNDQYSSLLDLAVSIDKKEQEQYVAFQEQCDKYDEEYSKYREEYSVYSNALSEWANKKYIWFRALPPKPVLKNPIVPVHPNIPYFLKYSCNEYAALNSMRPTKDKYRLFSIPHAQAILERFKENLESKLNVSMYALEPYTMTEAEINHMVSLGDGTALTKLREQFNKRLNNE